MQFIHEYAHLFVWEQRGQDRSTVIELHVNEIWNAKTERIFVPPAAVTGGFWHNIGSCAMMTVRRESLGKSVEIIQTMHDGDGMTLMSVTSKYGTNLILVWFGAASAWNAK